MADLSEFWRGQKNIVLLDPNITACAEWETLFSQLIDSRANVDFSQGLDIRLLTAEKIDMLRKIKVKRVHFAWDKYRDKEMIIPLFREFAERTGWGRGRMIVYCLCNFDTTIDQDLERIYTLRDLGYSPYVMLYDKEHIPKKHPLRRMQRWCNNNIIFRTVPKFEDYIP